MKRASTRLCLAAAVVLVCATTWVLWGCSSVPPSGGAVTASAAAAVPGDAVLAKAFADHSNGLEVTGEGTVQRLLADDTSGERHQRFIVRLASGQTLLIAHNIDVASRVDRLQVGDVVSFKGEYVWNDQGGLVHWTHRDPSSNHPAGWIRFQGKTYQ